MDVDRFIPQMRAFLGMFGVGGANDRIVEMARTDGLTANVIKHANIGANNNPKEWNRFGRSISSCGTGFYLIYMTGRNTAHISAYSNEGNIRRYFDSDFGQYHSVPGAHSGPGHFIARQCYYIKFHTQAVAWRIYQLRGVPRDRAWLQNNP
ncbi:MAG: hypothetical protein GY795_03940 [Desulfobacterales bacterium]|nr:hypothetical protein [Desulfobacterales bacterium]